MSPRAAWRLDRYGFAEVYDYELGKSDWLAFDLEHEGEAELAGAAAIRDVPTCSEDERAGAALRHHGGGPVGGLVVVNDQRVVMGLLPASAAEEHPDARVGDVMRHGPTTVRPSEDLEGLRHRMSHAGASAVLVTRPDGVLVGAVTA